jgi:hypothetical protein
MAEQQEDTCGFFGTTQNRRRSEHWLRGCQTCRHLLSPMRTGRGRKRGCASSDSRDKQIGLHTHKLAQEESGGQWSPSSQQSRELNTVLSHLREQGRLEVTLDDSHTSTCVAWCLPLHHLTP